MRKEPLFPVCSKSGLLLTAFFVVGCTSNKPESDLALKSFPAKEAVDSLNCASPCDVEWERAEEWLDKHARGRIESVGDSSIQTEYSTNGDPSYGFSVTRLPDGREGQVIKMYMGCGNRSGCDVDPSRIRNAFFHYLKTGSDSIRNSGIRWFSIK